MTLAATFLDGRTDLDVAGFITPLRTESWPPHAMAASGKTEQQYTLTSPLRYVSRIAGRIEVPAGFVTDFASIPALARGYVAPGDPCIEYPSVVHDYLYDRRGKLPNGRALTRQECDAVLAEAMARCGARWAQRQIVYAAVRVGGASHWNA